MTTISLETLPPPPAHLHIVGIGGIGLSGLALLLDSLGYRVTGSDAHRSAQTEALSAAGIAVTIGHTSVDLAAAADLVISTRAVLLADPAELHAARSAGVPVVKRGEVLAMLANARRCVAVAGSHGKSTTSAMLVAALRELGDDPAYAVGAVLTATGTNAALGTGPAMVVEADEFDRAFLWLRPGVAVITNIEFDHPDIFPTQRDYDEAFVEFARQLRPDGALVLAADDPGCARLIGALDAALAARVVTFGETPGADWRLARDDEGWVLRTPDRTPVRLPLAVPGRHNARNAAAALAALAALGYPPGEAAAALASFTGIGRRFERIGESHGVLVIDDYAHHPSEIQATLAAARERHPDRRPRAVFQPHTFSRTKALLHEFAHAFGQADTVMILDIYPSRETDSLGISADDLRRLIPGGCAAAASPAAAVAKLIDVVEPGDLVLTMGAGDVTTIGPELLARLAARGASPARDA